MATACMRQTDPFPMPLEERTDPTPLHYRCPECGTIYDEQTLCATCDAMPVAADRRTLEADRAAMIGVALDVLPDLAVALMGALACRCDCTRRRVMLHNARNAFAEIELALRESGPGPWRGETLPYEEARAFKPCLFKDSPAWQDRAEVRYSEWLARKIAAREITS